MFTVLFFMLTQRENNVAKIKLKSCFSVKFLRNPCPQTHQEVGCEP